MTRETRTFISPSEIAGVQFECTKCHAKVTIPMRTDRNIEVPTQCCVCNDYWFSSVMDTRHRAVVTAIDQLTKVAKMVSELESQGVNLSIAFQLATHENTVA